MPNVDDHGLEVLKKAARNLSPTPKKDYGLQNLIVNETGSDVADVTGEKRLKVESASTQAIYQTLSFLHSGSAALNVNGSVAPVEFIAEPQPTELVFVESLQMLIADNGSFGINGFGGLTGLTNGVLLEIRSNGVLYTIKNLNNNADIFSFFSSNPMFVDKANLDASNVLYAGGWELRHRMPINPATGDFIRITVRDNLSGLVNFSVHAKTFKNIEV